MLHGAEISVHYSSMLLVGACAGGAQNQQYGHCRGCNAQHAAAYDMLAGSFGPHHGTTIAKKDLHGACITAGSTMLGQTRTSTAPC
jgi:hypothetical protein